MSKKKCLGPNQSRFVKLFWTFFFIEWLGYFNYLKLLESPTCKVQLMNSCTFEQDA